MGTRGWIGTRKGNIITGKYNHMDSYYDGLGEDVIKAYFDGDNIYSIASKSEKEEICNLDKGETCFLHDGLYCEFAYVYDKVKDRLEVYRGFFKKGQFLTGYKSNSGEMYYEHLIFIVDRKIHTLEQVQEAFKVYHHYSNNDVAEDDRYPERTVINICEGCWNPLEVGKQSCSPKCLKIMTTRAI